MLDAYEVLAATDRNHKCWWQNKTEILEVHIAKLEKVVEAARVAFQNEVSGLSYYIQLENAKYRIDMALTNLDKEGN